MRSKDAQRLADQEAISTARGFVVTTFVGRPPDSLGQVTHGDLFTCRKCATLEEARAVRTQLGVTDRYGRRAVIYAISREGYTIHVE